MTAPPFDAVLQALQAQLADAPACSAITPRGNGSLDFTFADSQLTVISLVPAQPGAAQPFRLSLDAATKARPEGMALARRVRDALAQQMPQGLGSWLQGAHNPNDFVEIEKTPQALQALLGPRFAQGAPLWQGWHLRQLWFEASAAGDGFCLAFSNNNSQLQLWLGRGELRGTRLCDTPLGPLSALGDASGATADALAFLVRCCLACNLAWSGKIQPRDLDDDWKDGLLDNSNRGSVEWYMKPSRFFGMWGYPDTFGLAGELNRRQCLIIHASRDCPITIEVLSRHLAEHPRPWGAEMLGHGPDELQVLTSDLDELSIALGGENKLSRIYAQVARQSAISGPIDAMLTEGCESAKIGDSPDALGEHCLRGSSVSLSFLQARMPNFEEADTRSCWARFLDGVVAQGSLQRRKNFINLVGLGNADDPSVRHIVGMLAELGIEVASLTMPSMPRNGEALFASAALSVVSPWHPVADLFTRPMTERGLPSLELPTPFGWQGTLRWLAAVCAALDLPRPDAALQERWRAQLTALAGESLGVLAKKPSKIAVVYDKGSLTELLSPRFFFGARLTELLGEGVDLTVVHAPLDAPRQGTDAALVAELVRENVRFVEHLPATPLDALLRAGAFDAVYCDAGDGEIVRKGGAAPLKISELRPGLYGQAQTARRLVLLQRMNLYRNYGDKL